MNQVTLVKIGACNVTGVTIANKSVSKERLQRSVFRILKENVLCSMATVNSRNRAHINTAYFCYSKDLEIFFLSHPRSVHCQNLLTNSSIAMTIFSSSQIWTEPGRGLQLFGSCRRTTGAQMRRAQKIYGQRFPAYKSWKETLAPNDITGEYRLYRALTERVKVHDEKTLGDGVFVLADVRRIRR